MPEPFEQLMEYLRAWDATAGYGEQKALADQLGVSPQTLNNWIKGRRTPSLKDGLKLQLFLKFQNGQSAVSRTRRG
jgi:DNA-binding XRE family transcriptional regulator